MNINALLSFADQIDDSTDDNEVAKIACELARVVNITQQRLDTLKPVLRKRAAAVRGQKSHVQYVTPAGRVSVTFPDPMYKPAKGLDWNGLRNELGDTFDTYFTTKVSHNVRKDIESVVKTRVASAEIGTVLGALKRDEPTPRVGFKPA